MKTICKNLQDTKKLAVELSARVSKGDVICLEGNLGAGKTQFAKYFISALNPELSEDEVSSPTFNICNIYDTTRDFKIWHIDAYRLEHPEEILEIGLDEALRADICLIEWSENILEFLPDDRIVIEITKSAEDIRMFNIQTFD